PFQSVGRLSWNLIGGAVGSMDTISPLTSQYSGRARVTPDGLPGVGAVFAWGATATSLVLTILAPFVGKPIIAGAIEVDCSASHRRAAPESCWPRIVDAQTTSRAAVSIHAAFVISFLPLTASSAAGPVRTAAMRRMCV